MSIIGPDFKITIMKAFIVIAILSVGAQISSAQIFVKHDATGTNDGTSWENAFVDLQDALDASTQGEQIWISSGAYKPTGPAPDSSHFYTETAVELYGGFSGNEVVLDDRDWEANSTIISGDLNSDDVEGDFDNNRNDNAHHVFYADIISGTIVLDGLTFEGGTTLLESTPPVVEDYKESTPWHGGGALVYGTGIIRNCTFRDNDGFRGSGLFAYGNDHVSDDLNVDNCLFENNNSIQGGFRVGNFSDPLVENCIFSNNLSRNFGSALTLGNSNATIRYCNFENNFSESFGGAIGVFQNNSNEVVDPRIQLESCVFLNNSTSGNGGAVWFNNFYPKSKLKIDSSYFGDNVANVHGGALFTQNLSENSATSLSLVINETVFSENLAQQFGGAIICSGQVDSFNIKISNTRLQSNACAGTQGGALWVRNSAESIVNATLQNVEFIDNYSSNSGGGIFIENNNWNEGLRYDMNGCTFVNNAASGFGGALASFGCFGIIDESSFISNFANGSSGAVDTGLDSLVFTNCIFSGNYTQGADENYTGGGAMLLWYYSNITISNTLFEENISDKDGAAVMLRDESRAKFENVLFSSNLGNNTIYNSDSISLLNVSMIDNEIGIFVDDDAILTSQNSVFSNQASNLLYLSNPVLMSKGSNISSDATLTEFLTGYNNYQDYHETDPFLGPDFVPLDGSLCIDRGNPDGISTMYDVAGNIRIQNANIDIGAFESDLISPVKGIQGNNEELTVFPNPVYEVLSFYLENDWNGQLKLHTYDLQGKLMKEEVISKYDRSQKYEIDVRSLRQGEYILMVSTGYKSIRTPYTVLRP